MDLRDLSIEPSKIILQTNTPFKGYENMHIIYTFDGTKRHLEGLFQGKKIELDAVVKPDKIEIVAKTPFEGYEIQHLAYTNDRSTYHIEGEFQGQKVEGDLLLTLSQKELVLKTPFTGYENMEIKYTFDGTTRHIEGLFLGKKMEIDAAVKPEKIEIVAKTPFQGYEQQHLSYFKDRTTYHAEGEFQGQKVEADLLLTPSQKELVIKTPFGGFERQHVSYTNDDFSHHLEGMFKRQKIEADLSIEPSKVDLKVKTPFAGFDEQKLSVSHELTDSSCNCKIESLFQGQTIEGTMTMSWADRIDGQFRIKSTFRNYQDQQVNFNFDKSLDTYSGHIDGIFRGQKIEADASFIKDNEIRLSLKTPFVDFEEQDILLSQRQRSNSLSSRIELTYKKEKYELDMQFKAENQLEGSISVKTPFLGYEETKAVMVHSLSGSTLRSRADLTYYRQSYSIDIAFTNDRKTEGSITIVTPLQGFENTKLSFNNKLSKYRTATHAQIEYGYNNKIEADIEGSIRNRLEGRVALKTPFEGFRLTELSASHNTKKDGFNSLANLRYGKSNKISISSDFSFRNTGIDANFAIESPFTQTASASVSSSWKSSHAEFVYGKEKVEADLNVNDDASSITFLLKTPLQGIETTTFTWNMNGQLRNMNIKTDLTYGASESISVTIKNIVQGNDIESSFTMVSPYTDDIRIKYKQTRSANSYSQEFEAAVGADNGISQQTTLQTGNYYFDFETKTTWTVFGESQSTTATLKHNGPLENFKTEASVETNGHKSNVVLSLKTDQKIEATFILKTPFECIKDIQARITHSGEIDQFVSSGEIQYNDMEKIQGKINFFKNKFRRLNANIEIITPFVGYEQTNFIVKHLKNNNGLRTSAVVISGRRKKISIFLKALYDPMEFELSTESPFRGYEDMSVKGKHQNGNTELILSKMQDQIAFSSIMDLSSEPMTAEVRLATPFSGFESSEIKMKTNTDISNLKSAVEIKSSSLIPITADVQVQYVTPAEMSGTFNFDSGIKNMEVIKVFGSNRRNGDDITTHLETSWNRHDPIVFDGTFGVGRSSRQGGISFSTPFKMISSFDAKCNYELTDKTYKDSMIVSMNGKTLVDMDLFLNFGDKHAFQVVVREPNPIKVETELLTSSGKKSGSAMVNWNTKRDDSQVKISGEYSVDKNKKNMLVTLSNAVKSVALKGSLERSMYKTFNSLDFLSDGNSLFGYEFQDNNVRSRNNFQRANKLRLCFPSRNVELYGSYNNKYGSRSVSGSFAWDADRDDSKRVGLKAQLSPKGEATLADISFEMPSIGQDVKLDSEMTINSGSVLFDGKTELRYSKDSAKTLVIRSRIEDVSYGYRKNYTLTFGLQHQFTNVDVQLASHVGKSNGKFSTGFDVKYLTAKRQRKNLALMAEIDSIKKQMNLMMRSPMKSIQMTGSVQTTPYKMSLRNVYDNTKVINTDFSLDTHKQSVNFQMNYDSENPNNVLHLSAKYVNDSAILAEIYREENSRKIVDSLLALRLNTSRLLHTRLHWRPTILQEIKESGVRRMTSGSQRLNAAFTDAAEAVSEELNAKYNAIRQSATEDLRPFITFIQEIMSNVNTEIKSLSSRTSSKAFTRPLIAISEAMENGNNMLEDLKSVVRQDFPMKKQYDFYVEASKELLEVIEAESVKNYVKLIDFISEQLKELSEAVEKAHTSYQGMVSKLSQNQATEFLNNKYDSLRTHLSDSKISENMKNVASKYTSAIYQARDQIATRLDGPAFRKIQGMSNNAYQMASAAYKFWEVEENVKSVLDKVYEMVRNEIKEEIDSVKNAVTRLQNSKFTVFNPQGGEIQMDSYLPVPMKSLKELPTISLNKHLNRMSSYIPDVSRIPSFRDILPDSDISNWLPPFYGIAKLEGSRVTTFDGQNFDFSGGKCSYVLTRDYMDGNFSIIADYLGKGKKKMIIQTATQTIQVAPNGKLRVDSKPVKPLYHSREVTITEMNNVISVSGNGFRVDIDIPHDTVIAQVSGWYHNRLGGIFGTLNQERYDDMITPARKLTTDVDYLVNTWEVDSKCR